MMNISKHISFKEGVISATGTRLGIKNEPTAEHLEQMKILAENVFEPLRVKMGKPIRVLSFYRSEKLNKAVGGSLTSQHCKGQAIDISLDGENHVMFEWIRKNLKFTQLIWEFGTDKEPDWIHIGYDRENLKGEVLTAKKVKGITKYHKYV
jgi:zinc D-Ala-D-Ala carboxypeptidase